MPTQQLDSQTSPDDACAVYSPEEVMQQIREAHLQSAEDLLLNFSLGGPPSRAVPPPLSRRAQSLPVDYSYHGE